MMETNEKLELLEPLRCDGIGGMALAKHGGRRVAVRWFPLGGPGADAASALEALPVHPAVPALLGRGSDPASEWTAFDHPEGELLSKRLEQGVLPAEAVISLGADVAGALAALHAKGVAHGELSLDSVLLAADGRTLLTDLLPLVANRVTDRRGETRALAALPATVDFFSPERAKGGPPSAESDVYALGALLCAAAGKVEPAPAIERLHAIAQGTYWPVVPAALDGDVGALLSAMLSANPQARPPAAEVERRLRELLAPDPFQALLDSQEVSAKGMTPGHEPTIQDAVLRAPTRVDVQPYLPKAAFREEPVSEPAVPAIPAPAVTAPEPMPVPRAGVASPDVPWVDPVSHETALPLMAAADVAVVAEQKVITEPDVAPVERKAEAVEPAPLPLVMVAAELSPAPTAPEVTPSKRERKSGPKPLPPALAESKPTAETLREPVEARPSPKPLPPILAELKPAADTIRQPLEDESIEARPTTPSQRQKLPAAAPPTIPQMRAVTVTPAASSSATRQVPKPDRTATPRRSGVASPGLLGWFAATNVRLGVLAGAATVCLLVGVSVFGEYQTRQFDRELAAKRPDGAALEREAQERLEDAPPSAPSPAQLRKGTEAADEF